MRLLFRALSANWGLPGSHGHERKDGLVEIALVKAIDCLQARPNFLDIVSTKNEYHQTLAHLSIIYGYRALLRRLVDWRIDLAISDVNGLTVLHCAYLKGDLDSVRILRRGGASEAVMDNLGRTPSDLRPEGSDLDITVEGESDSEVYQETVNNEQLVLGEQPSIVLGLYNMEHSRRSSGDEPFDDEVPDSMAVGGEGSVGDGSKKRSHHVGGLLPPSGCARDNRRHHVSISPLGASDSSSSTAVRAPYPTKSI